MASGDAEYNPSSPEKYSIMLMAPYDADGNSPGAVRGDASGMKQVLYEIDRDLQINTEFTAAQWAAHPLSTSTARHLFDIEP